jgi:hypothetical protein
MTKEPPIEMVAAAQQAIMVHPHYEGSTVTAFGFANVAVKAALAAQPQSPAVSLDIAQEARNLRGVLSYMEETNARRFEPAHVVTLIALVADRLERSAAHSRPLCGGK